MKNARLEIRAENEQGLCNMLDECIRGGSLAVALKSLYEVRDTFSKYEEYMKKVNEVIGTQADDRETGNK